MKKSWLILLCFIVLILGVVSLLLYLVGMQLSIFGYLNRAFGGWAIVVYTAMILIPAITIYIANTTTDIPKHLRQDG